MRRAPLVATVLVALLVLSGCAAAPRSPAEATEYDCNGRSVPRAALEERVALSDEARGALTEAAGAEGQEMDLSVDAGWFIVSESATRVEVLRALPELRDLENGEIPSDHEYLAVEMVDMDGTGRSWRTWSSSPCALRLELDGLGIATVALASAPDSTTRDLDLVVTERACNSGEGAEGRVEVVSLDETEERIEVVIGIRPRDQEFVDCPGNPATPFTVSLEEPVGDREVVDAGLVVPRAVASAAHPGS